MGTTQLQTLPYVNAGSVGLRGIDLTVMQDEKIISADSRVVHWGRARDGYSVAGVLSRVIDSQLLMTPGNVVMPTQITGLENDYLCKAAQFEATIWAAYNENHALKFATGATNGHLVLANGLPIHLDEWGGDFTIIFFGRPGPADNCYAWGNNQVPSATQTGTFMQWTSTGGISFQVNGTQIIANSATASPAFSSLFADGPRLVILSFSDSANKCRIRIDGGLYDKEVTGVTANNTEATLRLGTAGPANAGTIDGGDYGEFIVMRGYLTDDVAALLRIENLIMKRYRNKPRWWGVSGNTNLTADQAKALGGGERSTTRAKSFTVTAADQYVYYAYPSAAGAFSSYKINGADAVPTQTIVVINGVNHIILRSPTTLTGSITVDVA